MRAWNSQSAGSHALQCMDSTRLDFRRDSRKLRDGPYAQICTAYRCDKIDIISPKGVKWISITFERLEEYPEVPQK